MAKKKNRNMVLLKDITDLQNEIDYNNFEYNQHFEYLCNLIPNKNNEKLDIEDVGNENIKATGLVYIFTIDGKIFKIGHTITNIKKRIQSYNCGKTEYRINGTNSTTNYFVLQSLLNIGKPVEVYAFFPKQPEYEIFGELFTDSYPPSKRAENIILSSMPKKPIGCTQT